MDLFEHQGKELLLSHGLSVPHGVVATTLTQALDAAGEVGYPAVVKAQVRTGGRGKAGGIRVVPSPDELSRVTTELLGSQLKGEMVGRVLVEEALDLVGEVYVSVLLDRPGRGYLVLVSASGGVDIEEVARTSPSEILRLPVDPLAGVDPHELAETVAGLGIEEGPARELVNLVTALLHVFTAGDAELVEINPVGLLADGRVMPLDAKVSLDESARFRHPEWEQWESSTFHDDRDRRARARGLNYVGLDGEVGIIGNGAGLVLSTLDVVAEAGGRAANFLDVGGGASAEVMSAALEVVDSDPSVRAILVNIFGGITRGEEVARGIVDALSRLELRSPVVIRLDGTNAAEGMEILGPHLSDRLRTESSMDGAAAVAVALAGAGAGTGGVG